MFNAGGGQKPPCLGFGLKAGGVVLLQELIWVNFFLYVPWQKLAAVMGGKAPMAGSAVLHWCRAKPFCGAEPLQLKRELWVLLLFKITLSLS